MTYTIIYIHKNDSEYLDDILNITSKNNKSRIILIGDENNKKYANKYNIEFYYIKDYIENFQYTHISVNTYEYEKFCFERWIILSNFIRHHNIINKIIYSDSDNAILHNIANIDIIQSYDILYLGNDAVCVPNLLICDFEFIHIIKKYILAFYDRTYNDIYNSVNTIHHLENNTLHYSDMWLVKDVINNIAKTSIIFDINYNEKGFKIINLEDYSRNNILQFNSHYNTLNHSNISNTINIHFAGNTKKYTKLFI